MSRIGIWLLIAAAVAAPRACATTSAAAQTQNRRAGDLHRQGRRPRAAPHRRRQEGGQRHLLHLDADAGIRPAREGVRGEIRHQGAALARDQRPGDPAHRQRGACQSSGVSTSWRPTRPKSSQLARENIVAEFHTAHSADLPDWAVPPHRRWYAARANLWVVAFNTGKVKKEEIPPTYEGFVDPKWKGRIGIELTDQDWMYAVINYLGDERGMEMFRKLAALRPDMRLGHALLAQLIARRRDPGRPHGLFGQCGFDQEARRPDRLGRGRADRRPPAGGGGRAQRPQSERGAVVRRVHAVAGGAEAPQQPRPQPVEQARGHAAHALQVPDGRSDQMDRRGAAAGRSSGRSCS